MGRQKQVQPVEGAKEEEKPMEEIQQEIASQMPAPAAAGIKEQLEESMAAAKLKGAKQFLSGIFTQERTYEELRVILQDESIRPYLSKLTVPRLAAAEEPAQDSEPSEAAPPARRRGRPPGRAKGTRVSKNGGTRAVFGEEEKEEYVNTALAIVKDAGKDGIKRQDLVATLDKRMKDYAGKNWMVNAMIKTLTKKHLIKAKKDGTRSIYIAR